MARSHSRSSKAASPPTARGNATRNAAWWILRCTTAATDSRSASLVSISDFEFSGRQAQQHGPPGGGHRGGAAPAGNELRLAQHIAGAEPPHGDFFGPVTDGREEGATAHEEKVGADLALGHERLVRFEDLGVDHCGNALQQCVVDAGQQFDGADLCEQVGQSFVLQVCWSPVRAGRVLGTLHRPVSGRKDCPPIREYG